MSWADPRPEATAWYWDSAYEPHRDVLLSTLETVAPMFDSVLEIGCHCGPNLRRLRERFGPDFNYLGVDINALAVADAEVKFRDDTHTAFEVASVPLDLASFMATSFDLVFSSACLMCVTPAMFPIALYEMRRLARVAVVCHEPQGAGQWMDGQGWAHRYPPWVVTC